MDTVKKNLVLRNIIFQSLDTGIFNTAMVFFHQLTIMVAFIRQLYDSPLIAGLIPGLLMIGYNVPGFFSTSLAERFPFRKKFIGICGFTQRLFILAMALCTLLFAALGPKSTALLVLFCYFGFAFMGGMGTPAWLDFCAKTIPIRYRARTNAFRSVIAGAGGILMPLLIDYFLKNYAFPQNYRLTFIAGFCLLLTSFLCFTAIREPEASPVVPKKPFSAYLSSLISILRSDKNFVRFQITQVLLSVSECGAAFYTYYAIDVFGADEGTVVFYTFIFNLSFLVTGIILGHIGDKYGNLNVLRIGAAATFVALLLIVLFPSRFTLYLIFILVGLTFNTRLNSIQVFITEFGNDENRIRYTTLASNIGATSFGLMPLLGGILLANRLADYTTLFIVGAVFSLAAFFSFTFIVKKPGREEDFYRELPQE